MSPVLSSGAWAMTAWRATAVLAVSVVAALARAWLCHVPHQLRAAARCRGGGCADVAAGRSGGPLPAGGGVALAPYAVWMSVTAALSVGYSRLN